MIKPITKIRFTDLSFKDKEQFNGKEITRHNIEKLLSTVAFRYMFSEHEMVYIPANHLRNINDYRTIINFLKDRKILYVNENYFNNPNSTSKSFTKSYGFTDEFKKVQHPVSFLVKFNKKKSDVNCVEYDIKKKLMYSFASLKVSKYPDLSFNVNSDGKKTYLFKKYLLDSFYIQGLDNKVNYYHWSGDRLYSNFTQVSSKSRSECFKIKGHNIKSKDIKTSFPLFLSKWLKENTTIHTIYEFTEFVDSIFNMDFYSDLRKEYEKVRHMFNKEHHYSRNDIKVIFQRIINGDNKKDEVNYGFACKYPLVWEELINYKKDKDISIIYDMLSKMEADLLYNTIVKRLFNEIPDIKIISVHDQIYYQDIYDEQVNTIWKDEIKKFKDSIYIIPDELSIPLDGIECPDIKVYYKPPQIVKKVSEISFNASQLDSVVVEEPSINTIELFDNLDLDNIF